MLYTNYLPPPFTSKWTLYSLLAGEDTEVHTAVKWFCNNYWIACESKHMELYSAWLTHLYTRMKVCTAEESSTLKFNVCCHKHFMWQIRGKWNAGIHQELNTGSLTWATILLTTGLATTGQQAVFASHFICLILNNSFFQLWQINSEVCAVCIFVL